MLFVTISSVFKPLPGHVTCPNFILTGSQQGQLVDERHGRGAGRGRGGKGAGRGRGGGEREG